MNELLCQVVRRGMLSINVSTRHFCIVLVSAGGQVQYNLLPGQECLGSINMET